MRTKTDIQLGLDIPKRHELSYYMKQVAKLYGETPEAAEQYAEEQLKENEHSLDDALACFKSLMPPVDLERIRQEDRSSRFANPKK